MNELIFPNDVIRVTRSYLEINKDDEKMTDLILSIGCELLDVSEDLLLEMIQTVDTD